MKLMLTMPNVQLIPALERGRELAEKLGAIGFRFRERQVAYGTLLSAANSVAVELDTVEELVALQRSIGLPIRVEDGILEIRSD